MRWIRRLSIVAQIVGWTNIALFTFGIPGHIEDTETWYEWVKVAFSVPVLTLAIAFVVTGPLLWTSGWWFPRITHLRRREDKPLAKVPIADHPDKDLVRFKACLPHIQRCRRLIRPYAGSLGQFTIAMQVLNARDVFAQIATELEYLTKQLNELGIWCPDIWGEEGDDSLDSVHIRLRTWSTHLAVLEAKVHQGDLEGAQ